MLMAVPTYLLDEIDRRLDAEIAKHPDAEKDRAVLRSQVLAYLNEHGVIPDFSLERKSEASS